MAPSTCLGWIQPLNLECTVINIFAGSVDLFIFISFIVVAMLAARFRMSNGVALLMIAMYGIIFSSYMPGLYVLIILLGGILIFFSLKTPFVRD